MITEERSRSNHFCTETEPIFATPGFLGGYSAIDPITDSGDAGHGTDPMVVDTGDPVNGTDPMVINSGDAGHSTDPLYTDYGDDDGYGAADSY